MLPQVFHRHKLILLGLLPLLLALYCWWENPFAEVMVSRTTSITELSAAQKANIQKAAAALDGQVIKPKAEFSFNKLVGPRQSNRGYLPAPSYVGPDSPKTIGGGICLLSSAVYQLALLSNLPINQRVAHMRTIKTVSPGMDAAVWYGQSDLRFTNSRPYPLRLICHCTGNELKLELLGQRGSSKYPTGQLHRMVDKPTSKQIRVCVFRQNGSQQTLVSRDLYDLSP